MLIRLIDSLAEISRAETELLRYFAYTFQSTKRRVLQPTKMRDWTPYLAQALRRHYTHLHELGFISRISKGKYMLNKDIFNTKYIKV